MGAQKQRADERQGMMTVTLNQIHRDGAPEQCA
jgi:hypothetical protein